MGTSTISIEAFCQQCSVGRTKAYELIKSGEIVAIKIGRRTLITVSSVDDLIKRGALNAAIEFGLPYPERAR